MHDWKKSYANNHELSTQRSEKVQFWFVTMFGDHTISLFQQSQRVIHHACWYDRDFLTKSLEKLSFGYVQVPLPGLLCHDDSMTKDGLCN